MTLLAGIGRLSATESHSTSSKMGSIGKSTFLVAVCLFVIGVIFPSYGVCATSLDPSKLSQYTVKNTASRRIERGLGSPNSIERQVNGDGYIYWYNWTTWDAGKIKDRGEAGFQFGHDNRLTGFSIYVRDKSGKFDETTLQDVISPSKT